MTVPAGLHIAARRAALVLAAVAAGVAVAPASASAALLRNGLHLTAPSPNASTGLVGTVTYGTPGNPPVRAEFLTVGLPTGSRIRLASAPQCTAPRAQRESQGHQAACDPRTRIATGLATVLSGGRERTLRLDAFNVREGDEVYVALERVQGDQRLAPTRIGVAGRAMAIPFEGRRMTSLTLRVPRVAGLLRAPARCPRTDSRTFRLAVSVLGTDGRRRVAVSRDRCRRL